MDMLTYDPFPAIDSPGGDIKPSIYARTLQKAAEMLGNERALARYLRIPMPDLFAWMRPGAEPPPMPVFLMAVDLVMNEIGDQDAERAQKIRVAAHRKDWTPV